ncbi:MAG TPA: hypothetical protein VFR24_05330 [Candidatus Angelobacter sp.]|nr:hypothetical protein [Candidatus Angelobacter sp.]
MMRHEGTWVIVLLTLGGVLLARLLYRFMCGFSVRSPQDVFPFLLGLDTELLNGVFHPESEEHFRSKHSPAEFRKLQWKRIHLALHYCNKLSNNARVLLGWTRFERTENWSVLDPTSREEVLSLRDVCIQCLHSSLVMRLSLRWWLVRMAIAPLSQPPTFKTLIDRGSADMISFYEKARLLAENFSHVYGKDYHRKLVESL